MCALLCEMHRGLLCYIRALVEHTCYDNGSVSSSVIGRKTTHEALITTRLPHPLSKVYKHECMQVHMPQRQAHAGTKGKDGKHLLRPDRRMLGERNDAGEGAYSSMHAHCTHMGGAHVEA